MVVLGFDPGGARQFGWCVLQKVGTRRPEVCASGVTSDAATATAAAMRNIADIGRVGAAAIDSPLFWVAEGDRKADKFLRTEMKRLGAANVSGTVQSVNSLRGACVAQGIMAAHFLRKALPAIRITESHPKALLWLLRIAKVGRPVREIRIGDLNALIESEDLSLSDHERDAALAAVAALAMVERWSGWRDLYPDEKEAFTPVWPIEYWMPIDRVAG